MSSFLKQSIFSEGSEAFRIVRGREWKRLLRPDPKIVQCCILIGDPLIDRRCRRASTAEKN